MDSPLRAVTSAWLGKIQLAWESKKKLFQDDADEALRFFNGPYDWLYGAAGKPGAMLGDDELPAPSFRMTCNKVAEMVQLFGPALYSRNPVRTVTARRPPQLPPEAYQAIARGVQQQDPTGAMAQQMAMAEQQQNELGAVNAARATLLGHYLNYTPDALDLKRESGWVIDEALIKGMGLWWTELYVPPGGSGSRMVGSFHGTVDDLLVDPDAEGLHEAKWVARRCVHPYWEVEREYGLPEGSLKDKATLEGLNRQGAVNSLGSLGDYRRKQGRTNDLLVYWKLYSKMGLGGRLQGQMRDALKAPLEAFGDYCFLVLCESCAYPLNLPPPFDSLAAGEPGGPESLGAPPDPREAARRVRWPIPFWADDGWPFTPLSFHWVPRQVWPMSHVKPGLGELKFLNWAYSMLAGKIRTACRDFLAVAKSAGEDLKDRIKHGGDYTLIEVEQLHGSIDQVVKFLQHPPFQGDIYRVIESVAESFERRTGLTELMYGLTSVQLRSAQEANVKQQNASIRPDDMAQRVEDAMSDAARKEALAARWLLTGRDVAPVMGPLGAQFWDRLVVPSDPSAVLHELEYRIEAGSAKKPNKSLEQSNMQSAMQSLFPTLWAYAQATGIVGPVNSLIGAWARSIDLDASGFLLPAPPAPPPAPAGAAPGPGRPPEQPQQPQGPPP